VQGNINIPPEREDINFANSAIASNSFTFTFASRFFPSAFSSSTAAMRAASRRSRSAASGVDVPHPRSAH